MKVRHSQAYTVAVYLLGIVIIGLAISVLMKPVGQVYNHSYNKTAVQEDIYQNFYTRSTTIWIWLPVILAFPFIFWIFRKAHERQGGGY